MKRNLLLFIIIIFSLTACSAPAGTAQSSPSTVTKVTSPAVSPQPSDTADAAQTIQQKVTLYTDADKSKIPFIYFGADKWIEDITTDINGNLYVANDYIIMRFTPDGKLDTSWGKNGLSDPISYSGCSEVKIEADSRGYVYYLSHWAMEGGEWGISPLKRYKPNGNEDDSWPVKDFEASSIAVDSKDRLLAFKGGTITGYNKSGKPDKKWGSGGSLITEEKSEHSFSTILTDKNDILYIQSESGGILRFSPEGKLLGAVSDTLVSCYGESDNYGNFLLSDFENNTITKYKITGEKDTSWCNSGVLGGTNGPGRDEFNAPMSIAVDKSDNIYVFDTGNCRIKKYNPDGTLDINWGISGCLGFVDMQGNAIPRVNDIAKDADGSLYLTESQYGSEYIRKFGRSGNLDTQWGNKGAICYIDKAGYQYVQAAESDGNGNTFIAVDPYILVYNKKGVLSNKYKYGDISCNILVTDNDNNLFIGCNGGLICKYSPEGVPDKEWTENYDVSDFDFSEYFYVNDMAFDKNGNLYMLGGYAGDGEEDWIISFKPNGTLNYSWGINGTVSGELGKNKNDFCLPEGIAVNSNGDVYVADTENNRIKRYKSNGMLDNSWYSSGIWQPSSQTPLANPTKMMFYDGKLYCIWNERLFVISDVNDPESIKPVLIDTANIS